MMWLREIGCVLDSTIRASILASESSTQLNSVFRTMEYDTFPVKDEFHKNPDGEVRKSSCGDE